MKSKKIMVKSQTEKTKFRRSKKWLDFRKQLRKKQTTDPITLKPLTKQANCHHMDFDENNYEKLIEDHFIMLNSTSHELIHFILGNGKHPNKDWNERIERLKELCLKHIEINESLYTGETDNEEI